MKIRVQLWSMAAALALTTAAIVIASETINTPAECLAVHEWGTFTSVASDDGSAIDWDVLGGNYDLPAFVKTQGYRCLKFRLAGTVRMETPVLYFYSKSELNARVDVQFPHGVITEWYPKGENSIYESKSLMDRSSYLSRVYSDEAVFQTKTLIDPPPAGLDSLMVKLSPSMNGFDTSLRNLMSRFSWANIEIHPNASPEFLNDDSGSRYYAARATDADPISVGEEHEKFLFYRGVGRMQVPLSARVSSDGKIVITKNGSDAVAMAMLFENQTGRLGYSGGCMVRDSITLDRPSLNGSRAELENRLEKALVANGLFPKEAHAMVTTWQDSWFEEGSRMIYIVPSHAVDQFLPLHVDPAPTQMARVFVGRIELITPEIKRAVENAIVSNDISVGTRYGRFLDAILERIVSEKSALKGEADRFREAVGAALPPTSCRVNTR